MIDHETFGDDIDVCPFCGQKPYWEDSADEPPWLRIGCDACDYYLVIRNGDFDALKKRWNARVIPTSLREKIEQLKDEEPHNEWEIGYNAALVKVLTL